MAPETDGDIIPLIVGGNDTNRNTREALCWP